MDTDNPNELAIHASEGAKLSEQLRKLIENAEAARERLLSEDAAMATPIASRMDNVREAHSLAQLHWENIVRDDDGGED